MSQPAASLRVLHSNATGQGQVASTVLARNRGDTRPFADHMDAYPSQVIRLPADSQATLPLAVLDWLQATKSDIAVFVAADDAALQLLTRVMPLFAPDRRILPFPAWDNLPYDRARPSRQTTGTRVATLAWLATEQDHPCLVLTTPEALLQRVPPRERVIERAIPLRTGQELDPDWLHDTLLAFGYGFENQVDESGETAIHGSTADIHLAGAPAPIRLELAEGRIASMRWFDPLTQRSTADADSVLLLPATEAFTLPGEDLPESCARVREQLLPDGPLATLFDHVPDAAWAMAESTESRCDTWRGIIDDAFEVARIAGSAAGAPPLPPHQLYLTTEEIASELHRRQPVLVAEPEAQGDPPVPLNLLTRTIAQHHDRGEAVILCGHVPAATLRPSLARRLRIEPERIQPLPSWADAASLPPKAIGLLHLPLDHGFVLPGRAVLVIRAGAAERHDDDVLDRLASTLHIGDLVVDRTRGLARLTGLAMEDQAGAPTECLRLAFLGGDALLLPGTDADRIWRYGSSSNVKPDRLDSAHWQERYAEVEREIDATAVALVARIRERNRRTAPVIEPDQAYRRFVRRRPYPLTRDQIRAIRAVQQDLASGRPMLRLICGDVGFGKTEVALHAAALVAASGRQVAVAAPTTLLARQHLDVFRRQLAGLGFRIEGLIRSSRTPEAQAVLRDIRSGDVQIVIGTHAVAAARFRDLGLVVIDEEQRFGEAQKRRLREMQNSAHALIMTGTPLPRSLQAALSGLLEVSLLTTPPAARQSGRTFIAPFDPVVVRAALIREARRGGQSFFVCPRVEDIAPLESRLRDLVPELTVAVAHGKMRGEVLDKVMLDFADGDADVLLATSIIEAGLDLPNANTMLIWSVDKFGLAQLHQLRGRVGRGRVRASTYLLTDPNRPPSAGARKRLETVVALDTLGSGFAISLADLDQRGAGDLLGDKQAGHVRLFGTELYRDMLQRALARARGETVPDLWRPEIAFDLPAYVPDDFVPEPDARLAIYRQVATVHSPADIDDAEDDLTDRFGELPSPVAGLLDLARLRLACIRRGIEKLQAGPAAVALTPRPGADLSALDSSKDRNGRILLPIAEQSPVRRLRQLTSILT